MRAPRQRFWQALLEQRAANRWGNFSWLSLYTLLASANDWLAKLDGGRIIDTRRMRWVAAQRAAGIEPYEPISLPDARCMLLLGDPGEMDPSQYVLLRDLAAVPADALLLMSDIVYPAGDVNAWRDAVYLPYFGLPTSSWDAAKQATEGPTDQVTVPQWPVFATPGNHDWYDGLNGFMYHACGAEPLPPVLYSSAGLGFVQRLTRAAWKEPERPDRAVLDPLRAKAAERWPSRSPPGAMPYQPGPYFAIDIGRVRSGTVNERAALRLVTVDTGVDGSLDVEQARWIRRMLEGPVPKIVITGKPLIVDNSVYDMPINRSSQMKGSDGLPAGLRGLLSETTAERIIATVAGDIHNAQRMVMVGDAIQRGRECTLALHEGEYKRARELEVPPVQVVAGGGGAYLSKTHTTRYGPKDALLLKDEDSHSALDPLPAEAHQRFPSREVSAQRSTRSVGRIAAMVLAAIGSLVAAVALLALWHANVVVGREVTLNDAQLTVWHIAGASFAAVFLLASCAGAISLARRRKWVGFAAVGSVAVVSLLSTLALWDVRWESARLLALGTLIVVSAPVLPFAVPVLGAFPLLRRLVPIRLLIASVLGVVGAVTAKASGATHFTVALIVAVVVAAFGLAIARFLVRKLGDKYNDWTLHSTNKLGRFLYALATMWPILILIVPLVVLARSRLSNGLFDLALLVVLLELGASLAAFVGFLGLALVRSAWSFCPWPAIITTSVLSLVAGVSAGISADAVSAFASPGERVIAGFVIAVGVLFVTSAAVLSIGKEPAPYSDVAKALERRDGVSSKTVRTSALFRTMLIAAIPGVSEIAEASEAPFHKSLLTVTVDFDDIDTRGVRFALYGVDDEREDFSPSPPPHPARTAPGPDEVNARGSFLVDALTVQVPRPGSDRTLD